MSVKEIKVGDRTYFYRRLDAMGQLELLADLQSEFLGTSLGSLLSEDDNFDGAVRALSSALDGKGIRKWTERLFDSEHLSVEDDRGDVSKFDRTHMALFKGFPEILELITHILITNLKDPLEGWLNRTGLGQDLMKKVEEGEDISLADFRSVLKRS